MRNFLTITIIVLVIFCLPSKDYAQLNLGKIETCSLYSVNGAVSNYNISTFNGDVGAQIGTVSNFPLSVSTKYTVHTTADAFTAQAKIDLLEVYILLNNIPVTNTVHAAAFTNETVLPGVYLIGSAGSLAGTVTLSGSYSDIFIFKFQGAFSPAAATKVILAGGARACNVFWIAEGAISAGPACTLSGTFIAHPGAVTIGDASTLNGRMLSTTGAINFGAGTVTLPIGPNTIPIDCVSSCDNSTLGTAANFTLFTSEGALANTGISGVIGDVGSNSGAVSGFAASIVIGTSHIAPDAATAQAAIDLLAGYTTINNMVNASIANKTSIAHDGAYGAAGIGETLYPGIYTTAAAGSVAGNIILDGQYNSSSVFIFHIGAAFSIGAQSRVVLINGARRCNIFWTAEGAISMATFTFMKGNLISHDGAISMGGQGFLEGRMFSTKGACSFNTATTYISNNLCAPIIVLPIQLSSFTGNCSNQNMVLRWTTATEINSKNFTIQRSITGESWQVVGTVNGAGHSDVAVNYSFIDNLPGAAGTYLYRLKQTDLNNISTYSKIISATRCGSNTDDNISFSPNPSTGMFNFNYSGDSKQVSVTEIFNTQGQKVYQSNGFQSKINLSNQAPGIYVVRVHLSSKVIIRKIVISK